MANPPITIGPFDNVPAPGSPIRSAWPQELTQSYVDTVGSRSMLATNTGTLVPAGALAQFSFTTVNNPAFGGPVNFAFPVTGHYVMSLRVEGPAPPAGAFSDVIITANGVNYSAYIPPGKASAVVAIAGIWTAGNGFVCQVYNPVAQDSYYFPALTVMRVPAL